MATSPLTTTPQPKMSGMDEAEQRYQEALNALTQRLDSRKNRLLDPTWLAMAQGFLSPSGGNFFESLGQVAKNLGDVQRQEEREDQETAKMRLELAKSGRDFEKQKVFRETLPQLYRQVEGGGFELNPEAAQRLSLLSGDPQYIKLMVEGEKDRQFKSLLSQLYQETEGGFEPNPEIASRLARISGDPRFQEMASRSVRERRIGAQLGDLYVQTPEGFKPNLEAIKNLARITGDPKYSKMFIDAVEEQSVRDSISRLYTPEGRINPEAARQFAVTTKNPAILQTLADVQKAEKLREAGQNIFQTQTDADGKITYRVDTNALMAAARASDDPAKALASYADLIPKLRRSGMIKDLSGDVTSPFDAIVLMASSMGPTGAAYKAQAQRLARQYQTGMIEEDKANTLANQMMTAMNSSVDRAQALQNTRVMQEFQRQMMMSQQSLERDRLLDRQAENSRKLTEEQKITYQRVVLPVINQGLQADTALMQLEPIRQLFEKAPSGVFGGSFAVTAGRLFGTDANTALKQIATATNGLIPLIPRLPGAQSNFDAQKLQEALGKLDDPLLTNEARRALLNDVHDRFKNLSDRAAAVQFHWDQHKRYDPRVFNRDLPGQEGATPRPTPGSAPGAAPAGAPALRWNPATQRFE